MQRTLRSPGQRMRENPATAEPDADAPAAPPPRQLTPAHADAIEIFAEVLAQSEDEGLADDFYSRLCEGITRCTALRRVVIFRYDSTRRRILAAGAFGVDLELFRGDFFTLESASLAREALEQDRVLEIAEDLGSKLPAEYVERLAGAHRRLLAGLGARALAGRDPRRPRRRGPAADRARARGAVDPRQDGGARGDGARRDAPARARGRARAAHRPGARGPRGRRAAPVRRLARAVGRAAVRRADPPALRRGGPGRARRPARPRCSARSGARRRRPPRRWPRRSSACATSTRRSASRSTTAPSWRRRPRSSRSRSRCSPRRSATPTSTRTPRASACAAT